MENKTSKLSQNIILILIAMGIWTLVLQNAGVIPTNENVKVVNEIDANVRGRVSADVSGSVTIDNTVDINIEAVNGYSSAFYGPNKAGRYDALHVYTGD